MPDANRYSRQTMFAPIGADGQARIRRSRVVVIGCGALGSNGAQLLARAGVGTLTICDRDFLEMSNLQRQTLFDEQDVRENLPKAVAAARKLRAINGDVTVNPLTVDVNAANVLAILEGADVIVDGLDNFESRFLLNDACLKLGIPWIYGACLGSYGLAMTISPGHGPCLRCILPDPPTAGSARTCDTAGILNTVAAAVASIQANEALKILAGKAEASVDGIVTIDLWKNTYQIFRARRNPDCPACAKKSFDYLSASAASATTALCGRNAVQIVPARPAAIDLRTTAERLAAHGTVRSNEHLLKLETEKFDLTLFPDGRAIVKGTDDPMTAKNIYAKYVGI